MQEQFLRGSKFVGSEISRDKPSLVIGSSIPTKTGSVH